MVKDAERNSTEMLDMAKNEAGEKWVSIIYQATDIANRTLEISGEENTEKHAPEAKSKKRSGNKK